MGEGGNGDLTNSPYLGTPLLVPIVRTQVCDHNNDAQPRITTRPTWRTWWWSRACQLVACPTARATPGQPRGAKEGLWAGRSVDTTRDTGLPTKGSRRGATAARAFCAIIVALEGGGFSCWLWTWETKKKKKYYGNLQIFLRGRWDMDFCKRCL